MTTLDDIKREVGLEGVGNADLAGPIKDLMTHPYSLRFIQKTAASGDNRVRTADDVLGERKARLASLLVIESKRPGWMILPDSGIQDRLTALVGTVALASIATPYLWTEEVRAALRDTQIPRHVLSPKLLPQPRSWHTFETGITIGGTLLYKGEKFNDGTADAMLVWDGGKHFCVCIIGEMTDVATGEQRPSITGASFEYGKVYPDDFDDNQQKMLYSALIMFSFLNSPYIPKERQQASRPARREVMRAKLDDADELVTFVILRRPTTKKHDGSEEPQIVNWKHQWIVSGHVRAQWYPSEQAHHLIWIAPYLKGPSDAPMLEHAYKVAR